MKINLGSDKIIQQKMNYITYQNVCDELENTNKLCNLSIDLKNVFDTLEQ